MVSSAKNSALSSAIDSAGARLAFGVDVDVCNGAVITDGEPHAAKADPRKRFRAPISTDFSGSK